MNKISEIVDVMRLFFGIKMAIELKFPEIIDVNPPISLNNLEQKLHCKDQKVQRLIQFLASHGFFKVEHGYVYHTDASIELVPEKGSRKLADFYSSNWCLDAFSNLSKCVDSEMSSFEKTHGKSLFNYLASNEPAYKVFNRAMTHDAATRGQNLSESYNFGHVHSVADIGGGTGDVLRAIIQNFPSLQGILFDTKATIDLANATHAPDDRICTIQGSFFNPLPLSADVLYLYHIIHDWSDVDAIKVLMNCSEIMKQGSRLLIIERILGSSPRNAFGLDLTMMALTDRGRERDLGQFEKLLENARLKLINVTATKGADFIIEAKRIDYE